MICRVRWQVQVVFECQRQSVKFLKGRTLCLLIGSSSMVRLSMHGLHPGLNAGHCTYFGEEGGDQRILRQYCGKLRMPCVILLAKN
jgi:hypothetical protein